MNRMNRDCKNALARIAKVCRENIAAFGPTYDPRWKNGLPMRGAKSEGNGMVGMAGEIMSEIWSIRREHRCSNKQIKKGRDENRTV